MNRRVVRQVEAIGLAEEGRRSNLGRPVVVEQPLDVAADFSVGALSVLRGKDQRDDLVAIVVGLDEGGEDITAQTVDRSDSSDAACSWRYCANTCMLPKKVRSGLIARMKNCESAPTTHCRMSLFAVQSKLVVSLIRALCVHELSVRMTKPLSGSK